LAADHQADPSLSRSPRKRVVLRHMPSYGTRRACQAGDVAGLRLRSLTATATGTARQRTRLARPPPGRMGGRRCLPSYPAKTPGHPRPLAKGPTSPAIHRADSRRKRAVTVPARWSLAQTGPKGGAITPARAIGSPSSGLAQRNCSRDDGDCPGHVPMK
jgi:hypothetical protein